MFVPTKTGAQVVAGTAGGGLTIVPEPTPLTRLHYFDGKYLRAEHLTREQDYLRAIVHLSNQAGGAGVVHGYDTVLQSGTSVHLGPGLAIDPQGRPLLLPSAVTLDLAQLIEQAGRTTTSPPKAHSRLLRSDVASIASRSALRIAVASRTAETAFARSVRRLGPHEKEVSPDVATLPVDAGLPTADRTGEFGPCVPGKETEPGSASGCALWLLTISHAERYCGFEDVFGKLCEEACITSQDRPWIEEGILVRLRPLVLQSPLPTSRAFPLGERHLRSRVASSLFRDEAARVGSWISGEGLKGEGWCLGADLEGGFDVPIAVVGLTGPTVCFLDAWTARRERIEAPAKRYWAWRMAMRPWDVFLGHVLQFQCQLAEVLAGGTDGGPTQDCPDEHAAIRDASETITHLERLFVGLRDRDELKAVRAKGKDLFEAFGGLTRVTDLKNRLFDLTRRGLAPRDKVLLRAGMIELPSAGWLPVQPSVAFSVNRQVRALLGDGVDLRYCVVRPDYVGHAFETAQHMERISLLHGLDHPDDKPKVDILVPDGVIVKSVGLREGSGFDAKVSVAHPKEGSLSGTGAARAEVLPSGGAAVHFAGAGNVKRATPKTPVNAGTLGSLLVDRHADALDTLAAGARRVLMTRDVLRTQPVLGDIVRAAIDPKIAKTMGAIWLSLRCDRNPLEMGFAETTPIHGRLAVQQPTDPETIYDLRADAELRIASSQKVGKRQRVEGVLSLALSGRIRRPSGDEEEICPRLWLRVVVESMDEGSIPSLTIALSSDEDPNGTRAELSALWGDNPLTVNVTGTLFEPDKDAFAFLTAKLDASPTALQVNSPPYNLSIAAIDLLAASLNEPLFRETGRQTLFPPLALPTDETTVRATKDWVFFQRRREKNCGVPTEVPVALPPVRYRVWRIDERKLPNGRELVFETLKTGTSADVQLLMRQTELVGDVTFDGGLPTLQSNEATIRQDWINASPGDQLVLGVVSTRGSQDDTIEVPRLARVERVIASVSTPTPEHETRSVADPLAAFAPVGTDGYIVLVTNVRKVETTCHEVYRFVVPRDGSVPGRLQKLIDAGKVGDILELDSDAGLPLARKLKGEPVWERDTMTEIAPIQDLGALWAEAGDGLATPPTRVFTFLNPKDERIGTVQLSKQRHIGIASRIGLPASGEQGVRETTEDLRPGCAAVTIGFVDAPEVVHVRTRARVVLLEGHKDITAKVFKAAEFHDDPVLDFIDDELQDTPMLRALHDRVLSIFRPRRIELGGPTTSNPQEKASRAARLRSIMGSGWKDALAAADSNVPNTLPPQLLAKLGVPTKVDDLVILTWAQG